jgi:isocitrate/isopropylmalate dehydrogenase
VLSALEETLASGTKTRDLGGSASTAEMTEAVIERLQSR